MNKRIFSVALALVLAFATLTCAFAAPDSISAADVTTAQVVGVTSSSGVTLPADFSVAPVAGSNTTDAVVNGINMAAASVGGLTTFFGEAAMTAISTVVPAVQAANLKLDEAFPISVANYSGAYGDVTVTLRLTKTYADGDVVVAMVGIIGADGTITWTPVEATVVNGEVAVTFPQAVLEAAAGSEVVVAMLSE